MRIAADLTETPKQSEAARPCRLHTVGGKLVQPDLDPDRTSDLVAIYDEADFANAQRDRSG